MNFVAAAHIFLLKKRSHLGFVFLLSKDKTSKNPSVKNTKFIKFMMSPGIKQSLQSNSSMNGEEVPDLFEMQVLKIQTIGRLVKLVQWLLLLFLLSPFLNFKLFLRSCKLYFP